ncbi:peroxisomal membrane protein 11C [Strongylocentrotus purpuratus]|uniref:Peroxisomal membrane protein 11C n=1 Tax=Strongylocentrotus purpuratus TaxID=7668 RepID=A0A7M7RF85_STRPU|nr:peroxisomal membrane protein 11C [Strongylocentrotus purpuratus]
MASSKFLVETTKLLQTYSGRDKVIRTVTYLLLMLSGISKSNENSKKLLTVSLQLSLCRTILRLFDDLPMLSYTLSYGLGRGERSTLMQVVGVVKNMVDQTFFVLEHIAWAADNQLIRIQSERWWHLSVTAWLVSMSLGVIKSSGGVMDLQRQRKIAFLQAKSSQDGNVLRASDLTKEQTRIVLGMLADGCDMCNAIHWMPAGFLWSNKLPNRWVGLFGTISSLIKLSLFIESRR